MNRGHVPGASARYSTSRNPQGQMTHTTYKAWRKSKGYRSFRSLSEAIEYRDQSGDVARVDEIITTIVWDAASSAEVSA